MLCEIYADQHDGWKVLDEVEDELGLTVGQVKKDGIRMPMGENAAGEDALFLRRRNLYLGTQLQACLDARHKERPAVQEDLTFAQSAPQIAPLCFFVSADRITASCFFHNEFGYSQLKK